MAMAGHGLPFYDRTMQLDDCLVWTGALDGEGYGVYWNPATQRNKPAHVYAWEQENGPVPDGLQLDHVWEYGCRYRHCVLMDHLEPVTPQENTRRARALITHCPQGHEYDEENTYITPDGRRQCRHCRRDRNSKRS